MRVLITGSNRGIGLEYVRQLLARGDRVFATCRDPDSADELQAMQGEYPHALSIVPLDVTIQSSVDQAREIIRQEVEALDLLINNAGVNLGEPVVKGAERELGSVCRDDMMKTFEINVVGPLLVSQAFLDLLKMGDNPKLVQITSGAGTIVYFDAAVPRHRGMYSYRVSKAALNMFHHVLHQELRPLGITGLAICPGAVKTDMSPEAVMTAEQSVRGQLRVIDRSTALDNGTFKNQIGGRIL